jgi:hypothetical protein
MRTAVSKGCTGLGRASRCCCQQLGTCIVSPQQSGAADSLGRPRQDQRSMDDRSEVIEMTADIVSAFVSNNSVPRWSCPH